MEKTLCDDKNFSKMVKMYPQIWVIFGHFYAKGNGFPNAEFQ